METHQRDEGQAGAGNRAGAGDTWPELRYADWADTCRTLHMWLQIVGKVRLRASPWLNHQWHATLYPTSSGLTTLSIPHPGSAKTFDLEFDFLEHSLSVSVSDGGSTRLELRSRSVAEFFHTLMGELDALGVPVEIHGSPNEVPDPVPFAEDEANARYDPAPVTRFFRAVASSHRVLTEFRSRFVGKCSPVHFFWGGMDLAVTRFSGRRAPRHPGGIPNLPDWVTREAYSHEVSSAGFWPGGDHYPTPIFYAYGYPEPEGYAEHPVRPEAARWDSELSEFVLPYDAVRSSATPEADLMAFLQSTYEAVADRAGWARERLEWGPGEQPPPGGRPPPDDEGWG